MKVKLDLPDIEGFEYTGEYRMSKTGEYISVGGHVITSQGHAYEYPILKKKAPIYNILGQEEGMGIFVEIRALKDIMELAFIHPDDMTDRQCVQWIALQELIK